MNHIKAPEDYSEMKGMPSVFLAGTIDMGRSENWQEKVATALEHENILVLNPRRTNWDETWGQEADQPYFRQQVEWELDALAHADMIAMHFLPSSKAPITLLELGIYAATNPKKIVVCCPQGYWRKGNVDIVCQRYGVQQVDTLEILVDHIQSRLT